MNTFSIRRALYSDIQILNQLMFDLHEAHHLAEPEHFKAPSDALSDKDIADYINAPDAIVYLALDGDNVVGFITGHFGELQSSVSKPIMMGSVDELYVVPEMRKQGVAKLLLEKCVREFRDYGVKQMFVEVWDFNKPALNLYKELGFNPHIHWLRKAL